MERGAYPLVTTHSLTHGAGWRRHMVVKCMFRVILCQDVLNAVVPRIGKGFSDVSEQNLRLKEKSEQGGMHTERKNMDIGIVRVSVSHVTVMHLAQLSIPGALGRRSQALVRGLVAVNIFQGIRVLFSHPSFCNCAHVRGDTRRVRGQKSTNSPQTRGHKRVAAYAWLQARNHCNRAGTAA